jgi:hypothetical protein
MRRGGRPAQPGTGAAATAVRRPSRLEVSDAFPEGEREDALGGERTSTPLASELSGLVSLARAQGIVDGRNIAVGVSEDFGGCGVQARLV